MMIALMKTLKNAERAKAREQDKKRARRNALACIVVGAETEGFFQMDGGIESCGYSYIQRDREM